LFGFSYSGDTALATDIGPNGLHEGAIAKAKAGGRDVSYREAQDFEPGPPRTRLT
jgi:hypothetical protein